MWFRRLATPDARKCERQLPLESVFLGAVRQDFLGPPSQIASSSTPCLQASRDMSKTEFLLAFPLHVVQPAVRGTEQSFDRCAVGRKNRQPHADADRRLLTVALHLFADACCDLPRFLRSGLRQDQCEFIAAESCRRIDRPAAVP